MNSLSPTTTLYNKYSLVGPIGGGNSGQVHLVHDLALNRSCALKILRNGLSINDRLREAQVGHTFAHNNLVKVYQADVTIDGAVLIAMEFHPKGAVTNLANPANFLPLQEAMRITVDVLQGLDHLHSLNIFHNDIKPENILIGSKGQGMLADYGIVGISEAGAPVTPIGSYVLHLAPEVVAGNGIEIRTDIFQLGLTLFRLLVGLGILKSKHDTMGRTNYLEAGTKGVLIRLRDFPVYIPAKLRRIIIKATSVNPNDRFQSALEMRRALEKLNFPGHWTVEASGQLHGHTTSHEYRFELERNNPKLSSFRAYKKNRSSDREIQISAFSAKLIPHSAAYKLRDNFIKSVVEGT